MVLQSEHCNVQRKTVMMTAMYKCWLICIIYFICPVHCTRFKGTFNKTIHQELSENIDGHKLHEFQNAFSLVLGKFKNQGTSSVSITNFQRLFALEINAIALQTMPKLENLPKLHILDIVGNGIQFISGSALNGLLNLGMVNMYYNELRSIGNRAFPSELRVLILRCNKLTFFTDTWFQNPGSVRALDLSGNQIEELHEGDFSLLTNLHTINLFNNHITTIGNAAFGYASPMALHLGFNNLSYISANMFARNITMALFHIDYNRLSFVSDDLFEKLNVERMSIEGNPWQCPCLRKMEKWTPRVNILKTKFKFNNNGSLPVCVTASNFADVCVPFIESELQQLYMDSLPTLPVDMCGITKVTGIPSYYYKWAIWEYLVQDKINMHFSTLLN